MWCGWPKLFFLSGYVDHFSGGSPRAPFPDRASTFELLLLGLGVGTLLILCCGCAGASALVFLSGHCRKFFWPIGFGLLLWKCLEKGSDFPRFLKFLEGHSYHVSAFGLFEKYGVKMVKENWLKG